MHHVQFFFYHNTLMYLNTGGNLHIDDNKWSKLRPNNHKNLIAVDLCKNRKNKYQTFPPMSSVVTVGCAFLELLLLNVYCRMNSKVLLNLVRASNTLS